MTWGVGGEMWLLDMYIESRGANTEHSRRRLGGALKGVIGLRYIIVDASSWRPRRLKACTGVKSIDQFEYPELKAKSHEYVVTQRPNTTLKGDLTSSVSSQDKRNAIYPSLPQWYYQASHFQYHCRRNPNFHCHPHSSSSFLYPSLSSRLLSSY